MTDQEAAAFASAIGGWDNAYLLVGGMAATLTGLLFVAMSFNLQAVMSDSRPELQREAIRTFNQFLLLIEVSIVMVLPQQSAIALGLSVAGLGLAAIVITAWAVRAHPVGGKTLVPSTYLLFLGFVAVGLLIIVWGAGALYLLLSLVIATLITSVFSAWALLVEVGRDESTATP